MKNHWLEQRRKPLYNWENVDYCNYVRQKAMDGHIQKMDRKFSQEFMAAIDTEVDHT